MPPNSDSEQRVPIDEQLSIEEGKAIMRGGLGEFELRRAVSYCAPLTWKERDDPNQTLSVRNGSAFFLRTDKRVFGVTAQHVVAGWRDSSAKEKGPLCLTGNGSTFILNWPSRQIDEDAAMDIATFAMSEDEVRSLSKEVFEGYEGSWPPTLPSERCGLYYAGYASVGTRVSAREIVFGAVCGGGLATVSRERELIMQIEREHLVPAIGDGILPENFNFGGISGCPMITVVQHKGLRRWTLGGVVYQGPNTSSDPNQAIKGFELIKARPAHFIKADGTLDRDRFASR